MIRFCQILQIMFILCFIILTLGLVSVEVTWDDGTRFKYKGRRTDCKYYLGIIVIISLIIATLHIVIFK